MAGDKSSSCAQVGVAGRGGVLSPVPISFLLMQAQLESLGPVGMNLELALIPFLTGLATALAARLRRWWLLVPAGTCLAVGALLSFVGSFLISDAPEASGEGGELVAILASATAIQLGALAGVALVDYLTRDRGQEGDVSEPHPTQEDSPVG